MIDAYASQPHLVDHLAPIWQALPPTERGTFWISGRHLAPETQARYHFPTQWGHPTPNTQTTTMVANANDLQHIPLPRRAIFVEHGAGQWYRDIDGHVAYSGGKGRERVELFLTLNPTTAAREEVATPKARVVIVGSPRLDRLARRAHQRTWIRSRPVVALCWHWDCRLVPETRSAWPYYREAVRRLAATGRVEVLGHGHPRAFPKLAGEYTKLGIEPVERFDDVVGRADLVVVDNTSAGPEAAACGIPVLWVNAPEYRGEVWHGGRFWDWPRGQVTCADPEQFGRAVGEALAMAYESHTARSRERMVAEVYPRWTRGRAARLAVAAIMRDPPG